ncbi:MAG TPA: hypothetical protein VMS89_05530 [Methanoregulaceae archaeon]|nr:hypothetical protein [Methanoregulaceae archaeon]
MKTITMFSIAMVLLLALCGAAFADRNIPATPEIQGISTSTSIQAQGTVTETDSLAWTSASTGSTQASQAIGPPLGDQQVQYTTGYNDQYVGVSGQTTFVKSMAVGTGNKIADGSNVAANTNIQFIAIDTGRATRSEDILLDGVANSTSTGDAILCPFASATSAVIPPYCNIIQAGSGFDSTLTSTVSKASDRFVGTDSTFPVTLNYNVASKGITLSDGTSSPMIGSASAYVKAHIQEARNSTDGTATGDVGKKSEDIVYSETSTASGLINSFSKSISYQSGFNLI